MPYYHFKLTLWFLILGTLLPLSQINGQEKTKKIQEEVERLNNIMIKATRENDYETILKHYAEDAQISPGFATTIKGKEALREAYKESKEKGMKTHSFSLSPEDLWVSGDKIFERGTFGMAVSSRETPKPFSYHGSYIQIWKKQSKGSYQLWYVIWNLDFNPFEHK